MITPEQVPLSLLDKCYSTYYLCFKIDSNIVQSAESLENTSKDTGVFVLMAWYNKIHYQNSRYGDKQ